MKYLFDKFPQANSEQLSVMRMEAICAATLASVAVKRLGLHKVILVNNSELSLAISQCVPLLEITSGEDIVKNVWSFEAPKPISDVLESTVGAVFVDSGYNYELASSVIESIMDDVLPHLSPSQCRNPVSRLLEWGASLGCTNIRFT
jgi:endoribonuclease Dicer